MNTGQPIDEALRTRITFDPAKLSGQACIRGLRIPVATIIRCVASGMTRAEILADYPDLEDADITAAIRVADWRGIAQIDGLTR